MPTLLRRLGPVRFHARSTVTAAALVALVALVIGACAPSAGASGQPNVSVDPKSPALIAHGLMFDKSELDVPGNQPFDLVLDNDDGVPHNIAIYSDEGHSQVVFRGDIGATGIHVYHVPAIAPGTYYFQCDVHPQMKGMVVVAEG
jgi:plastocyanin